MSVDPHPPPTSLSGLTGDLDATRTENRAPAALNRSLDKRLYVLRKPGLGRGVLGWWAGPIGVGEDDERGGCGSYGERAGCGRVDEDMPGPEA